jgi:hypothetical protein
MDQDRLWGLWFMKFSASLLLLFLMSAALVIASLIGFYRYIPGVSEHSIILLLAGYGVLALGVLFRRD